MKKVDVFVIIDTEAHVFWGPDGWVNPKDTDNDILVYWDASVARQTANELRITGTTRHIVVTTATIDSNQVLKPM